MTIRLEINNLSKKYEHVHCLKDISLDIEEGQIVALLGANGAGKSTLMSIIAGAVHPSSGEVCIYSPTGQGRRPLTGYALQDISLVPMLTGLDNLRHFAGLLRLPRARRDDDINCISKRFDLEGLLHRPVHQLSVGQRRRIHTAIAVLGRPLVVLMDEVTAGVDVETREVVLGAVRACADEGSTVVYSTHYLEEVSAVSSRVAMLRDGILVYDGATSDWAKDVGGGFITMTVVEDHRLVARLSATLAGISGIPLESVEVEQGQAAFMVNIPDRLTPNQWNAVMSALAQEGNAILSIQRASASVSQMYSYLSSGRVRPRLKPLAA